MLRSENVKSENVTVGKCRIAVGNCHIGNSLSEIVLSKNVKSEIVTESPKTGCTAKSRSD